MSLLFASMAFAQLDTNSVTVTASRTLPSPPDQVIFGVFVTSDLTKSLADVVNAVSSVGSAQANFSTLTQVTNPQPGLQWGFGLVVPFGKLKDTAAALATLAQASRRIIQDWRCRFLLRARRPLRTRFAPSPV